MNKKQTHKQIDEYLGATPRKRKSMIRARLTVYGHEDMTAKELKFFKKWVLMIAEELQNQEQGDLNRVWRATLFKE